MLLLALPLGAAPLTLRDCLRLARQRNPLLRAARQEERRARMVKRQALTRLLPQVSFRYHYLHLNEPYAVEPGALGRSAAPGAPLPEGMGRIEVGSQDRWWLDLELAQPLYTGGRLWNAYRMSARSAEAARWRRRAQEQDLVLAVKTAYFQVLKAQKLVEVAEQALRQWESHLRMAQAYWEVGMIPRNDLLAAKVRHAEVRQELVRARTRLQRARAQLNRLLHRPPTAPLELAGGFPRRPWPWPLERCLREAERRRPELRQLAAELRAARHAVAVARSQFFPQVSLVASWGRQGDTPSLRGTRFEDAERWQVMVWLEVPIWQWGRRWFHTAEQRASLEACRQRLEALRDRILQEVKDAWLELRQAEHNIPVAESALEQAQENFRLNEERYRQQMATTTDVLDAQTLLVRARTNYYTALADYNIARARLEHAVGLQGE